MLAVSRLSPRCGRSGSCWKLANCKYYIKWHTPCLERTLHVER